MQCETGFKEDSVSFKRGADSGPDALQKLVIENAKLKNEIESLNRELQNASLIAQPDFSDVLSSIDKRLTRIIENKFVAKDQSATRDTLYLHLHMAENVTELCFV